MLISFRSFSTSTATFQVYTFNGQTYTYEQIVAIDPLDRTLAQWSVLVDWDRQKRLPYVVIDPYDPRGLLYLSQNDYLSLGKVTESARKNLLVVARPGDSAPTPSSTSTSKPSGFSSKNSPWDIPWESNWNYSTARFRRAQISWTRFTEFRNSLFVNVAREIGEKMASGNYLTISRILYMWSRSVFHYAGVDNPNAYLSSLRPLGQKLAQIMKHNGPLAGMTYLKINLFVLYSFISGNPVKCTRPLGIGVRLSAGLPSCWGKEMRHRIRQDNLQMMRIMASILNMYRGIKVPGGEASFASITAKHPYLDGPLLEQYKLFCTQIFPTLLRRETGIKDLRFKYKSAIGLMMLTAGANAPVGMLSMVRDAQAWATHAEERRQNYVSQWIGMHKDEDLLLTFEQMMNEWHQEGRGPNPLGGRSDVDTTPTFANMTQLYHWPKAVQNASDKGTLNHTEFYSNKTNMNNDSMNNIGLPHPCLGRLHFIREAAGKVRIVAIADYWTQVCLKPVHDHLMNILGKLSTDATFDQSGIVQSYYERGLSPHWSFDLKAATDTIPLQLYKIALQPVLASPGDTEAGGETQTRIRLWASMLTDRDWITPAGESIRYNCGQPMGAYSSWASMAYVHHSLVQFAAWRANLDTTMWYRDYLVLGDDVDIAKSQQVADGYVNICTNFSIQIGMVKSLQSNNNCFEFANRRFSPLGDISPISLREEQSAQSWTGRIAYAERIIARLGSNFKNEGMALVRSVLTYHQWHVLKGLMTRDGALAHRLADFVEFMVTNPIRKIYEPNSFVTLEGILNWLFLIVPDDGRSRFYQMTRSTTQIAKMSYDLSIALLDEIESLLRKKMMDCPKIYSYKSRNPMGRSDIVELPLNLISTYPPKLLRQSWYTPKDVVRGVTRYDEDEYPHAHTARAYLLYCMFSENKRRLDALHLMLQRFLRIRNFIKDRELRKVEIFRATTVSTPERYSLGEVEHPGFALNEVLRLYYDVLAAPDYLRTDPNLPATKWLVREPIVTPGLQAGGVDLESSYWRFEEVLRAPIRIITPYLARHYGIYVPSLPYLNLRGDSAQNNKLNVRLRSLRNLYMRFHELRRNDMMTWLTTAEPQWSSTGTL